MASCRPPAARWTRRAGAFLLGRKTYEIFAGSWPNATDPADEIATALNTRQKFVASRTLAAVGWNNSHLLGSDVPLLQTLLRHDLVDTLWIWQFPVVLGTGKRLFAWAASRTARSRSARSP
jgi:dihydrofolate reductase